MSEEVWCRLCLNICNDYRKLYDETGQYNAELYDVTIKYFHPTVLSAVDGNPYTVMCLGCWRHISEFDQFKNDILVAQERLTATTTVKQIKVSVKEEPPTLDTIDDSNVKYETEFLPLTDLELMNRVMDTATSAVLLPKREVVIGIAKVNEEENDDSSMESDDEVGTFTGGEFNNIDEHDETPSTSNAMERSPQVIAVSDSDDYYTDEDNTKATPRSNDRFIAKWMPTLTCYVCQKECPNFVTLENHFKLCHPNEKVFIECCDRKFHRRARLAEHVCIHVDPSRLRCKVCNIFFTTKTGLRQHMIKQHPKSREALNYGPRFPKSVDAIEAKWMPKLECAICTESSPSLTLLLRHFKVQHHHEAFHIYCCERKLSFSTAIRAHALHHKTQASKQRAHERAISPMMNMPRMAAEEASSTDIPYEDTATTAPNFRHCNICRKSFRPLSRLQEHIRTHTGYFQCPYCFQAYTTALSVWRHMKDRHPDKKTIPASELISQNDNQS